MWIEHGVSATKVRSQKAKRSTAVKCQARPVWAGPEGREAEVAWPRVDQHSRQRRLASKGPKVSVFSREGTQRHEEREPSKQQGSW